MKVQKSVPKTHRSKETPQKIPTENATSKTIRIPPTLWIYHLIIVLPKNSNRLISLNRQEK